MKKNLFSWIVILSIVLVCVYFSPTRVHAADSGSCGNNLTWTLDTATGVLTIEGTGDMNYYSSGQAPWMAYKPYIKELVVKEGVISISSHAFSELTALKAVTIPASITTIKNHAFIGCTELEQVYISNLVSWCRIDFGTYTANPVYYASNLYLNGQPLTDLVIPSEITSLGYVLFANCDTLKSVKIPNSVTKIGEGTFDGCSNLTTVTIPGSVTAIGEYAFASCSSLQSIALPNGITSIEGYAFNSCDKLKSINIPNGVTTIERKAFYHCKSMTSVVLPSSLKLIESDAFLYCPLQHVLYKGSQTQWEEITIVQYNSAIHDASVVYNATDGMWGEHTYGNWTMPDNNNHERVCTLCNKKDTGYHRWDFEFVTEQPTCGKEGVNTIYCTVCNGTKTEAIPKLKYHKYDNDCDTNCNNCNQTRTVTHNYQNAFSKDKVNHWIECFLCGDKKDLASHAPGAEATETTPQTCTTCGYILKPALNHIHSYSNILSNDREGHWYACGGCSEQKDYSAHIYTNACDADCNTCGYTRSVAHDYKSAWSKDATNHWIECSACQDMKDLTAHVPGAEATETTPQICIACGYIIKPALNHTHNFATEWTKDEDGHWHDCPGCEEKDSYAEHSWDNGLCTICGVSNPNATPSPDTPTDSLDSTNTPTEPTGDGKEAGGNNAVWIITGSVVLAGGGVAALVALQIKKKLLSRIVNRIFKRC